MYVRMCMNCVLLRKSVRYTYRYGATLVWLSWNERQTVLHDSATPTCASEISLGLHRLVEAYRPEFECRRRLREVELEAW